MRGLRRHGDEQQGLQDDRRRLIHRYGGDEDQPTQVASDASPTEQSEESPPAPVDTRFSTAAPEVVEKPIASAAPVVAAAPVEPVPAEAVLRVVPPVPDRRVAFDVSYRTLEQVARLCGQVEWARVECDRRRERLVAMASRPNVRPPSLTE